MIFDLLPRSDQKSKITTEDQRQRRYGYLASSGECPLEARAVRSVLEAGLQGPTTGPRRAHHAALPGPHVYRGR